MPLIEHFHEVRFPVDIARGAHGGPERRTEVVLLASGYESRNSRWADSRRKYNAGLGIKSIAHLDEVIGFFEERRGRLFGFRFRDPLDHLSCSPDLQPTPFDQEIGVGNGTQSQFQLRKRYGTGGNPYFRTIDKPHAASLTVAVAGQPVSEDVEYTIDITTGILSFLPNAIPDAGALVTAGYEFDTPVRFDTDVLVVNLSAFNAGDIPDIPLIEVKP